MKRLAALILLVPALLALTGCNPECVDTFDCAERAKKENAEYTCVANKCTLGTPFPDAGTP